MLSKYAVTRFCRLSFMAFFCGMVLTSCATKTPVTFYPDKPIQKFQIDANFDTVWILLTDMMIEREYEIESVSKEAGLITTKAAGSPVFNVWPWGSQVNGFYIEEKGVYYLLKGNNPELSHLQYACGEYDTCRSWKSGKFLMPYDINYRLSIRVRKINAKSTSVQITPHIKIPYSKSCDDDCGARFNRVYFRKYGIKGWIKVDSVGEIENIIINDLKSRL